MHIHTHVHMHMDTLTPGCPHLPCRQLRQPQAPITAHPTGPLSQGSAPRDPPGRTYSRVARLHALCPTEHGHACLTPSTPGPWHTKAGSRKPGGAQFGSAQPSTAWLSSGTSCKVCRRAALPGRDKPEEVPDAAGQGAGGSGKPGPGILLSRKHHEMRFS